MFIKSKLKIIIFTALILSIVLILVFLTNKTSIKIIDITPPNNSTNIDSKTQISILFNGSINPKTLNIKIEPDFNHTIEFQEKNTKIIIKHRLPLSDQTKYKITLVNPLSFISFFTTKPASPDQQLPFSNKYAESFQKILNEEKPLLDKNQAIATMRISLPITKNTFSIRYSYELNSFIVKLNIENKEQSKIDFLTWLTGQNVSVDSINIIYAQSDNPDFTIASTNITDAPISIVDGVKIIFTDPIKAEGGIKIKIGPDIKVLLNFNRSLTELTIVPQDTWTRGTTYQLTILSDTTSQDSQKLGKDYQYSFKISDYQGL